MSRRDWVAVTKFETPEDTRPLGRVNWADTGVPTDRIHTFNDPRSPATPSEQSGIRNQTSNIPFLAKHNSHEQLRAMNRSKGYEED